MFLDDMPSATLLQGSAVQYAENVPLGFLVNSEDKPVVLSDGTQLNSIAIFNHLDIEVQLHKTFLTDYALTSQQN